MAGTVVTPGYGAYLQTTARYAGATVANAQAQWGDKALDSSVVSPLAFQADAQAEATKQAQFLAGPCAQDKVTVKGLWKALIGQTITLFGDRLGYALGPSVFVLGASEDASNHTTLLTVLKRL